MLSQCPIRVVGKIAIPALAPLEMRVRIRQSQIPAAFKRTAPALASAAGLWWTGRPCIAEPFKNEA